MTQTSGRAVASWGMLIYGGILAILGGGMWVNYGWLNFRGGEDVISASLLNAAFGVLALVVGVIIVVVGALPQAPPAADSRR